MARTLSPPNPDAVYIGECLRHWHRFTHHRAHVVAYVRQTVLEHRPQRAAAEVLGVPLRTLQRWMQKYPEIRHEGVSDQEAK